MKGMIIMVTNKTNIVKLGFVGSGMGGSRLAAECADYILRNAEYPYNSLLINMNIGDQDSVHYNNVTGQRKILLGSGHGTAINPEVGYKILDKERIRIERAIEEQFKENDFIFLTAGLGGGTGTGALLEIIKILELKGYKNRIGLMLIMPRMAEGTTRLNNTLNKLNQLEHLYNHFSWLITIDKQKLFDYYINNHISISTREYCRAPFEMIVKFLESLNMIHGPNLQQVLKMPCWINIVPVDNSPTQSQMEIIYPFDKDFSYNSISAVISQHIDWKELKGKYEVYINEQEELIKSLGLRIEDYSPW